MNITNYIDINLLNSRLSETNINICNKQVLIGEGTRFYEDAKAYNPHFDKSRVIIGKNTHIRGQLLNMEVEYKLEMIAILAMVLGFGLKNLY